MSGTLQRKRDHLALCHRGEVSCGAHRGLFDGMRLVHQALPELAMSELDLATDFLDHRLRAPLLITGMTGGPPEAGAINRALAKLCEGAGIAFGLGSQRILTQLEGSALAAATATFEIRSVAPDVVLLGNIGVNQARELGPARVRSLVEGVGADYLAVHLNPAMELVQPGGGGDRDFRDGYETIDGLLEMMDGRVIVKECGAGLAPSVINRLRAIGVRAVDVSGSGGTSWVKVEALRAEERGAAPQARLGRLFADWGIPTAAAIGAAGALSPRPTLIASGGIGDGLEAAKALALGADLVGLARPMLQAYLDGGSEGAAALLEELLAALRMAMALTGSRQPVDLRRAPRVLSPALRAWIDQLLATGSVRAGE